MGEAQGSRVSVSGERLTDRIGVGVLTRVIDRDLVDDVLHEGRHTHRTWLSDDGISDVGRAARLGHKLPGTADVYEHLTPEMKQRTLKVLQARWESSVAQLTVGERDQLLAIVPPKLRKALTDSDRPEERAEANGRAHSKLISKISPETA
jgi:hypothetical protein